VKTLSCSSLKMRFYTTNCGSWAKKVDIHYNLSNSDGSDEVTLLNNTAVVLL